MLTKLSWLVLETWNWLDLFSVCMCFWDPCALKIFVERCSWELKMLFGSLVELHIWLHSCLCFSPLEKLFLKSWLDTSLTPGYLSSFQAFSYHNLTRSSIASGSIESFSSSVFASFFDISSTTAFVNVVFLNTFLYRWLDTSRHLYLSRIAEALYIGLSQSNSHFLDLSWSINTCSPPKSLTLTPNLFPKCFSSIFKDFPSLGKLRFSHFHAFHSLKPKFLGFLQNFGFLNIKEVFMQFLGWFLKVHS